MVYINLKIDVADKASTAYTGINAPGGTRVPSKVLFNKVRKGSGRDDASLSHAPRTFHS